MTESILRLPEVKSRTGLSRSTIYQRINLNTFPKPVSIGERAIGFVESEIQDWIKKQIEDSRSIAA